MNRTRKFTKLIEMPNTTPNPENPKILKILIQAGKDGDRMTNPSPSHLNIERQIQRSSSAFDSAVS